MSILTQLAALPAPMRILAFLLGLGLFWLPLAVPIAVLSSDSNQTTIAVMLILFIEFLIGMRWWGRLVYGDRHIFQTYGLTQHRNNWREAGYGLGLGLTSLLLLFAIQGSFGWVIWQIPGLNLIRIGLEGFLVALGVGLAEELVFRGWILHELQQDYRFQTALWLDSSLFAVLHFLKPLPEVIRTLPQFPALVLLGLILGAMKRSTYRRDDYRKGDQRRDDQRRDKRRSDSRQSDSRQSDKRQSEQKHGDLRNADQSNEGRLGLPIGFHAGLVWGYYLLNVGQLVDSTHAVPDWVTGIDGNPLAGAIGLIFLLSWAVYWQSSQRLN